MAAIRITPEQLNQGLSLAGRASMCSRAIICLWGNRESLPREDCGIIGFSKTFESDSPALFGEFIELSGYKRIIQNHNGLQIEGGNQEQMREARFELYDLMIFAKVCLLVAYPIFLANNGEVPFFLPREIKKIKDDFLREPPGLIEKEANNINPAWFGWVNSIMSNMSQSQKYTQVIRLIFRLFIQGIKKTQLPCLSEMPEVEKEEFFKEIMMQRSGGS